jgi:hypothetical protein
MQGGVGNNYRVHKVRMQSGSQVTGRDGNTGNGPALTNDPGQVEREERCRGLLVYQNARCYPGEWVSN